MEQFVEMDKIFSITVDNKYKFKVGCYKRKLGKVCSGCPLRFVCLTGSYGSSSNDYDYGEEPVNIDKEEALKYFELEYELRYYDFMGWLWLVMKHSKARKHTGALEAFFKEKNDRNTNTGRNVKHL